MTIDCAEALQREFGYSPDESMGERWVVYRDHHLLVFHPDNLIKVFRRGGGRDDYYEIEPLH